MDMNRPGLAATRADGSITSHAIVILLVLLGLCSGVLGIVLG